MDRKLRISAAFAVCWLAFGCGLSDTFFNGFHSHDTAFNGTLWGGLYSHTVEPLTFNRTPTDMTDCGKPAEGRINQFQDPWSSVISVRMGKNGLADVAKEHGMQKIYHADLERRSVFFGFWSRDVVHVYGN